MLISFSVGNFRSFGEEQTLNMIASNKLSDHPSHLVPLAGTDKKLLRTAVIYGANAAGKSNLVKAMKFAKIAIIRGLPASRQKLLDGQDFRFGELDSPRSFEFRFVIDGEIFAYGFDLTKGAIQAEWLAQIEDEKEHVLFERDASGQTTTLRSPSNRDSEDPNFKKVLMILSALPLQTSQLFLNRLNDIPISARGNTFNRILQWFLTQLVIVNPDHIEPHLVSLLFDDRDLCSFASGFLNKVGTGIDAVGFNFRLARTDELETPQTNTFTSRRSKQHYSDIVNNQDMFFSGKTNQHFTRRLTSFRHHTEQFNTLPFNQESDGTKQLLHLMPLLYSAGQDGKVIVIDELDRSLHPLICWEFIRLFSETNIGAPKQLIVTTHEAHLLNQELLRRDEYWFVEKDDKQQSQLTSLVDFKVRNDLQIEKGYLHGRFGAIPMIGSMADLEAMLNTPPIPEDAHAPQDPAPGS